MQPLPTESEQNKKKVDPAVGCEVIAGLAIFFFLMIVIPFICVHSRRRRSRALHAPPTQRKEARKKLRNVVVNGEGCFGTVECAICIGPVYNGMQISADTGLVDGNTQDSRDPPSDSYNRRIRSRDELLTLRACQHTFHAPCLVSWFLIERYDCPVCRRTYFQHENEIRLDFAKRLYQSVQQVLERTRNRIR